MSRGRKSASIAVDGPLKGFTRAPRLVHRFWGSPMLKDVIEAVGIPHTEWGIIRRSDGKLASASERVHGGEEWTIGPHEVPRALPPNGARFVVDANLGRLARELRLRGFDALWSRAFTDSEIVRIARRDGRVILTRDVGLLKRKAVSFGAFVHATDPSEQIDEVEREFGLRSLEKPFTRCVECNGELVPVAKAKVESRLDPNTRRIFERFYQCRSCGRVYWEGSHYERMRERLAGRA